MQEGKRGRGVGGGNGERGAGRWWSCTGNGVEDEEGGMGSETGGDWNTSGVWDGAEEIRGD